MQTYKIYINDRNYTTWEVFETNTFQNEINSFNSTFKNHMLRTNN